MAISDRIELIHLQQIPLGEGQISFPVIGERQLLLPGLSSTDLARVWDQALVTNPRLFDATRVYVNSVGVGAGSPEVRVVKDKYSTFFATMKRMQEEKGTLTEERVRDYMSTGLSILGLAVAYESSDHGLIVQNRSPHLTQGGGLYHLPSGGVLPPDTISVGSVINPFVDAHHQLKDEQGEAASQLGYLGIARSRTPEGNPTLIFTGTSPHSMDELDRSFRGAVDRWESNYISFVSSDAEGLLRTMRGEPIDRRTGKRMEGRWYATGLGGLVAFGYSRYDSEWVRQAQAELRQNPSVQELNIIFSTIDLRI